MTDTVADPRAKVAGQVAYEVCVSVPVGSEAAFEEYMITGHIAQIYDTGRFANISFVKRKGGLLGSLDAAPFDPAYTHYQTTYTAKSDADLDHYLTVDRPAMSADFAAHCPAGVIVERRTYTPLGSWP